MLPVFGKLLSPCDVHNRETHTRRPAQLFHDHDVCLVSHCETTVRLVCGRAEESVLANQSIHPFSRSTCGSREITYPASPSFSHMPAGNSLLVST